MKHKTWFRLVLKAIGVALVGLSLPTLVATAIDVIGAIVSDSPYYWSQGYSPGALSNSREYVEVFLYILPHALQLAFGLYLFFGGKWIVNKAIPSNRPYCAECGYELSKSASDACPECGTAVARP